MLTNLTISYPDFKISEVIEPDHFDTNNADIKKKIDAIIAVLNQLTDASTDGASGADSISLTAIAPYASTKLQSFLEEVIAKLKSTGGSAEIGTPAIAGVTGTTVKDQLNSLKTLLDGHATRLTTAEGKITNLETRATNVEGRATILENRATSLETRATNLEDGKSDKSTTYTKTNVDSLLVNKTDKTGDHLGTWQGYSPMSVSEGINKQRIDTLEANATNAGIGVLAPGTDWNTFNKSGFVKGLVNSPVGFSASGFHTQHDAQTATQFAQRSGRAFFREIENQVIGLWKELHVKGTGQDVVEINDTNGDNVIWRQVESGFSGSRAGAYELRSYNKGDNSLKSTALSITPDGNITLFNQSTALIVNSGTQSVTNGVVTKVTTLTNKQRDVQGEFDSSRFTAKDSGMYGIRTFTDFGTGFADSVVHRIYKNGSPYAMNTVASGVLRYADGVSFIYLNSGEYIEFYVEHSSTSAKTLSSAALQVVKLS